MGVNWEAEREKIRTTGAGDYLKDGVTIFNLEELVDIEDATEKWDDGKGGEEVRTKKIYHFKDMTVKIPLSVHNKIAAREKDGFYIIKIERTGTGKFGTKYEVIGWERRK